MRTPRFSETTEGAGAASPRHPRASQSGRPQRTSSGRTDALLRLSYQRHLCGHILFANVVRA
jgi:hypothetical protein